MVVSKQIINIYSSDNSIVFSYKKTWPQNKPQTIDPKGKPVNIYSTSWFLVGLRHFSLVFIKYAFTLYGLNSISWH